MNSLLTIITGCLCLFKFVSAKGCVQLDTFSFDKVTSKFKASLIKFDNVYPYGDKHSAFEKVCEAAYASPDLLVGEVQVKDYGEKDNEELAKRFGVSNKEFPVVKLLIEGKDPINFETKDDKDFNEDNLKRFIRSKSGVYIGLPGCLEKFDEVARKFASAKCPQKRKEVLKEAEQLWDEVKGNRERKSAETYVKVMRKIVDKGDEFISSEKTRVENLLKGKISSDKKTEMEERVNILHSFVHDEL